MLNKFFQQEAALQRKKQIDELVAKGRITQEQADSALRSPSATEPKTPTPDIETRKADIEQSIEDAYANVFGQKAPTLQETLHAYSQNPEVGGAMRENASKAVPQVTLEQNAAFDSLSAERRDRVVSRIMKGVNINTAMGTGRFNMLSGWPQEAADFSNRWNHWSKEGYGLPHISKHLGDLNKKFSPLGPVAPAATGVAFGLGIIRDTIVGGVTGTIDMAKGKAELGDFLHVMSLASIPFTAGATAASASAQAVKAGVTVGNAARYGRVLSAFAQLNKRLKHATRDGGPGTWGGLNFSKWGEMGAITKTSMMAEWGEYITNPDELWYEIIGDVGLQGATRAFGNTAEWATSQMTDPQKQMQAQERGITKRLNRVRKIDAGMADAFQASYDQSNDRFGTEMTPDRVAALDALIETINDWENNTKANWMRQNGDENEVIEQEVINAVFKIQAEKIAEYNEELQTETESTQGTPEQTVGQPQPVAQPTTPTSTPTEIPIQEDVQSEVSVDEADAQEGEPEAADEVADDQPPEDTGTSTPERQRVTELSQQFDGISLDDLDLGEIEGINNESFVQSDENQNTVVRTEIENKSRQVFDQGQRYLETVEAARTARAEAEANPDDNQKQLDADEAELQAEQALENWLNIINAKIGKEPEGEETTNDDYIADEGARATRHQELGDRWLDVAAGLPDTEESGSPEEAQVRSETKQRTVDGLKAVLAEHADRPTATPDEMAPDVPPAPTPEAEEIEPEEEFAPAPGTITQRVLSVVDASDDPLTVSGITQIASTDDAPLTTQQVGRALQRLRRQGNLESVRQGRDTFYQRPSAAPQPAPAPTPAPAPAEQTQQTALDDIFSQIEQDNAESDETDPVQSPFASELRDYTRQFGELLASGAITPDEYRQAMEQIESEITDLESQQVRTEDDRIALRVARQKLYHMRDALGIYEADAAAPDIPDIIDGVLYFKYGPSSGPFKSLSNFFPILMNIGGKSYASVENYFQSMKFTGAPQLKVSITTRDSEGNDAKIEVPLVEAIRRAAYPGEAWKLANQNFHRLTPEQRADWNDNRRDQAMREALFAKFTSPTTYRFTPDGESKTLAQWLLDTGETPLVHIEHVSNERRAITGSPPYWGVYQSAEGQIGENRLGGMLMQLRTALRSGSVTIPEGVEDPRMIAVSDLPDFIQQALGAVNINAQHLYTFREVNDIVGKIQAGALSLGVGGTRQDRSSFTSEGRNPLPREEIVQRKERLARSQGWLTATQDLTPEVEERVDVYNRTQQEGADAALAVGRAMAGKGVIVTGGAIGSDISAIRGAVGTAGRLNRGSALAMMPTGIKKTEPLAWQGAPQYNPNVRELDDLSKNIGAISMYPEDYDANEMIREVGDDYRPAFVKHLKDRNGLVTAFSHVFFATHAVKADGGTADAAEKALQAGRPVVILDPAIFDHPLEGSEYLKTLPGVYVLKNTQEMPLYTERQTTNRRTGVVRGEKDFNGRNILTQLQAIAEMHYPDAPFAETRKQALKDESKSWSDTDFQKRIASFQSEIQGARLPHERLILQAEVALLRRIRAENHPTPKKASPVNYNYVSELTEQEKQVTGAVIGLRNYDTFEDFHYALRQAGVKVFVDVRQNVYDKERDAAGNFVENWTHGTQLTRAFAETDIQYIHASQFTPRSSIRQYQQIVDELTSISKMRRGSLSSTFTAAYHNFLRKTEADMGMFIKEMIDQHIGIDNVRGSSVCFGCVEHESGACHRSILGEIMKDALGISVVDVHAGGLTTAYQPHQHTEGLPPMVYSGKTAVVINEAYRSYVPRIDSLMELIDYGTDTNGSMMFLRYRHADYPMWEIQLNRTPDNTIDFRLGYPQTQTADLLKREAEIEADLGGLQQSASPFVSQSAVIPGYQELSLDTDNIPVIAEHALRSLAASVNNPELYADTENVEPASDDPLYPAYNSRLQVERVQLHEPAEGAEYIPITRRVGERVVMSDAHQTRDEDQTYQVVDQGVSPGTRFDLSEHETLLYSWRDSPDLKVQLSASNRYLSVVVPQGKRVEMPANFPINIHIHQEWESFLRGTRIAESWAGEQPSLQASILYEYLSTHQFLWHAVNAEGFRLRTMSPDGLPPAAQNLPENVYAKVYGAMSAAEVEADWRKIRSFMARGRAVKEFGVSFNPEEVDAARRFALRAPQPPNILTQVRRYLTAAHKAVKRLDPVVDAPVNAPDYKSYEPRTLEFGALNDDTNTIVGGDTGGSIDVEQEEIGEQVAAAETSVEELENVEPEEGMDAELQASASEAEEGMETIEASEVESEVMEMARDAGAAGIPFESTVRQAYARQWYEDFVALTTESSNGLEVQWRDGSIQVRQPVLTEGLDGRLLPTNAEQKAGFTAMRRYVDRSLRTILTGRTDLSPPQRERIAGIREQLAAFSDGQNFEYLSLWNENNIALKALLNTLENAYNTLSQFGALGDFDLKAHLLPNLPFGGEMSNTNQRRLDFLMTNTGKMIPYQEMHHYIVDPETKQVHHRPPTQLAMLVDVAQMTDPNTGETVPIPDSFTDNNQHGQAYEVLSDTDEMIEVKLVGTDYTVKFLKTSQGRIILENREAKVQSHRIFVDNWQDVPLNTTDATQRALAPIAMAVRHGFFTNANVPLQLYSMDMANEGAWTFHLKDAVEFDRGAEGRIVSDDHRFVVEVVPTSYGFVYEVAAYQGTGEGAAEASIFRTNTGTSTHVKKVLMKRDGVLRSPQDAIMSVLWYQREAALAKGWKLPESSDTPIAQEIDYQRPPTFQEWNTAGDISGDVNPNDVYFQSWEHWSSAIEEAFGKEIVLAAERAVFGAEYPINTRTQVMTELNALIADAPTRSLALAESPARLRMMFQLATPGLLRRHLQAQNAFTPTHKKFSEIDNALPIARRYRHEDFLGYYIEVLEGSGVADITFRGVSIGAIDFSEGEKWGTITKRFDAIVREHLVHTLGRENIQTDENGDVLWEGSVLWKTEDDADVDDIAKARKPHSGIDTRIRFFADQSSVIGEQQTADGWQQVEETRIQLDTSYAAKPRHEQFKYTQRVRRHLNAITEKDVLRGYVDEETLAMRMGEGAPIPIQAGYTGVVTELPQDIDDEPKGYPPVFIRRFEIDGSSIQIHLLPPDKFHPNDVKVMSAAGTEYWQSAERENGDIWRRVTFFDAERGKYVRYERATNEWVADPYTFVAEPIEAFEAPETGALPAFEYPADPAAYDEEDRQAGFTDLRDATQGEVDAYRAAQIWMNVEGASDSLVKQKVEDIFASPGHWSETYARDVVIPDTAPTVRQLSTQETSVHQEIESRNESFLSAITAFNQNSARVGSQLPPQPKAGLTPDGVMVAVSGTTTSLEVLGFSEGSRVYRSADGWELTVTQITPESFDVTATHESSGASMTFANVPEMGYTESATKLEHMAPDVRGVYEAQGYFAEGEEPIGTNAFDNAAMLASRLSHHYARQTQGLHPEYDALLREYPDVTVSVDSFIESMNDDLISPTDTRMDTYATQLSPDISASERSDILQQFKELETVRRNLQVGLRMGVSNYYKQQAVLQGQLQSAGIMMDLKMTRQQIQITSDYSITVNAPDFSGVQTAIHRDVASTHQAENLLKIVDSLRGQYQRLVVDYPAEIEAIHQEIYNLKAQHFVSPVFGRMDAARLPRNTQDVTFAYLSEYLSSDEMSGHLLGAGVHPAHSVFDYLFDMDESHPGYSLMLDPSKIDMDTGNLTLDSTLSEADRDVLLATHADTTVIQTDMEPEGRTIDETRVIAGSYHFRNNPFIEIRVLSQRIGAAAGRTDAAGNEIPGRPAFERVIIGVEPRFPHTRQDRDQIRMTLEIEDAESTEGQRLERLPRIVEQVSLANYSIFSGWLNPTASASVVETTATSLWTGGELTTYQIADVQADVLDLGDNQWVIGFSNNDMLLYPSLMDVRQDASKADWIDGENIMAYENFRQLPNTFTDYAEAPTAIAALKQAILKRFNSEETFSVKGIREVDGRFMRMVEPRTLTKTRLVKPQNEWVMDVKHESVLFGEDAYRSLGTFLQNNRNLQQALRSALEYRNVELSRESEIANNLQRIAGVSVENPDQFRPERESLTGEERRQRVRELVEEQEGERRAGRRDSVSRIRARPAITAGAGARGRIRTRSTHLTQDTVREGLPKATIIDPDTVESSFLNRDGTPRHPVLTDLVPVGAEDIRHPETRAFIGAQWQAFLTDFDSLSEDQRIARLRALMQLWNEAYLAKWDTATMTEIMVDIRHLAARSALTAWIARQPAPEAAEVGRFYSNLVKYSADMFYASPENDAVGDATPHLAFAAERMANIQPEDTIRVDDAGDGLIASFLKDKGQFVDYVENVPLRRAIFDQLMPGTRIESHAIEPADVVLTQNTSNLTPSQLLASVHQGGRLVIYGDSDWHRVSAAVIASPARTLKEYAASPAVQAIDDNSRALHLQLFSAWRDLNRQIKGTFRFRGDMSDYSSESGVVIVIDNVPGSDRAYQTMNLANQNERAFSDYISSFDEVRNTRGGSSRAIMEHRQRMAAIEERKKAAKARSDAVISVAVNRDKAQIFKNYPEIAMSAKGISNAAQTGNLIPQDTQFSSMEELAIIADLVRNPSMSTTQLLLVRDGTVQASILGGIRSGEDVRAAPEDVTAMLPSADAQGYDTIAVVNRPSGDTSITEMDLNQVRGLAQTYPGFKYLLIRNGETYSAIIVNRDANGNPTTLRTRKNVLIDRPATTQAAPAVSRPSWTPEAEQTVSAINDDLETLHSEHIGFISRIVESEDDWAVVALMNQDGTLADMVDIPNAFDLDATGANQAIRQAKALYGGADAYLFLASSRHITNNSEFFRNTGWGEYLSGTPGIRGHYLVGDGGRHATNRIKTYPVTGDTPGALRMLAKQVASNVSANLHRQLERLMTRSDVQGNIWEQAKAMFVQTLNRDLTRTQSLTATEEKELRNQLNLATSRMIRRLNIPPDIAGSADAEAMFEKLQNESRRWQESTTLPLNGAGMSVSPAHAYLMHYLSAYEPGDVTVIPDAGEGMLAAFQPSASLVLATESDLARRTQLKRVLDTALIGETASTDLAAHYQSSGDTRPNVVLLDGRNPETFWQQLNQALHTVDVNGRVVAHINLKIDAEALAAFKQQALLSQPALKEHYQLRMFGVHDNRLIIVADRVETVDTTAQVHQTTYESTRDLIAAADAVRMSRTLRVPQPSPEAPVEEITEVEPQPAIDPVAEAVEQSQHTKPESIDINKEETHREWLTRTAEILLKTNGTRWDITTLEGATDLYDNLMQQVQQVNIKNLSEQEARKEIYRRWRLDLNFTPDIGWERFLARVTAASLSYNPDMVYKLKLYEMLDRPSLDSRNIDIQGVLDPRTDEVDTLVSTAFRLSHNKPVRLIGETIADAEDAAILFQPFRNPAYEKIVLMGVDEHGKVVKPFGLTSKHGFETQSFRNHEIERILADHPEIKGFWLVHNHPEIDATVSLGDSNDFDSKFARFGSMFKGMVITDTGEYSAWTPDGERINRQRFEKPIDETFLQRPTSSHAIIGTDAGYSSQVESSVRAHSEPEYIADLLRNSEVEIDSHPDLVTLVFVRPELESPGGPNRMVVVGYETHKGLHTLDPETLRQLIRERNSEHGAFNTFAVVTNPSDKSLYDVGSAWHTVLTGQSRELVKDSDYGRIGSREDYNHPLISGVFVETDDKRFPMKNRKFAVHAAVEQGLTTPVSLDMETGDPINARKQANFSEYLLFQYLAQGDAINWEEARTYADRYFDTPLSDNELRAIGDIAFKDYLKVENLEWSLTRDNIDTESQYMLVNELYRRMINPESSPIRREIAGSEHLTEYLTYYAANLERGETFDYAADLYDGASPLRDRSKTDGIHVMNQDLYFNAETAEKHGTRNYEFNTTEEGAMFGSLENRPRTPTVSLKGIGAHTAAGGVEGDYTDPLAVVRDKLIRIAPRGRLIVRIDGGTFSGTEPMPERYSGFVAGEDGVRLHTPLLSKIIPAYLKERADANYSIEQRNEAWDLPQHEQDYYDAMLGEIFNPKQYTMRAFIRTSEFQSFIVIDNMESEGEAIDVSVDPNIDTRTLVEKFTRLRYNRPKMSAKYLRPPPATSARTPQRPPRMTSQGPHVESALGKAAQTYQAEVAAATGTQRGRPIPLTVGTEFGRRRLIDEGETVESAFRQSDYPQLMVKGLNNQIDRQTLEALFAGYGDILNVVVPPEYGGNIAWVRMRNTAEAEAAIAAINGQLLNNTLLEVEQVERDERLPIEDKPTGNPDSPLAWDVFLNNPLLPSAVRRKWMSVFDIEEVKDRADKTTYLRKEDSSTYRKAKDKWQGLWKGRGGRELSRPIDHIERWGEAGQEVAIKMKDVLYDSRKRGADMEADVIDAFNALRANPSIQSVLRKGSTEKIYSSQSGYLPAWIRKVPGIRIWNDESTGVERVIHKGKTLTHQDPDGRWATELYLSNAPLLDAWVNSYFGTRSTGIFPKDAEVKKILSGQLEKIRANFNRQDMELVMENTENILPAGLLTPVDHTGVEDITEALQNDNLNADAIKAYAERFGIEMPQEIEVYALPKRGSMRQWVVVAKDGTDELFRLRQFDSQQSIIAKARRDPEYIDQMTPNEYQRHVTSLSLYDQWTNKTLIYQPNPRDPIWSKKSGDPFQLFAGRPHDMPKMINWAQMNPYAPEDSNQQQAYIDYLKIFYEINLNAHKSDRGWTYNGEEWTMPHADKILKANYNGFNDMRFDALEDDSELIFPSVAYESLPVLGEYSLKSAQRVAEILHYGQDGEIMKAVLDELENPENLDLEDLPKAILKLRRALGHNDFAETPEDFVVNGNEIVPFTLAGGVRRTTNPQYDNMTPQDWQTLVDANIVTHVETDEGRSGFLAIADPAASPGETTRTAPWVGGGEVEFEIAPNAGALINYAVLNLDAPIFKQIEEAKFRYAAAKDTLERHHTWNPKLLELGEIQNKMDMIYADPLGQAILHGRTINVNSEFEELVRAERARRNNIIYKGLNTLQNLAISLLMRLSTAAQVGTFHNPAHRIGMKNLSKGMVDEFSHESERDRVRRIGSYVLEVKDIVLMSAENVSQENLGFPQKLLGASKYWHWRHHGGFMNFMRAFYNRGNYSAFSVMERRLRGTAAVGGKHFTKDVLTDLLIPGKIKATGNALAARREQHLYAMRDLDVTVPRLLDTVLEMKDPETGKKIQWTEKMIDDLTEMPEKKALDTYAAQPHLAAVSRLTDRVMQVMPDKMHYAGTRMHIPRVLDHPFLRVMVLFQTMMIRQSQIMLDMVRYHLNMLKMPAKVAAERAGKDGISIAEATKLTSREVWRKFPHFTLSAAAILGSGFTATVLMNLARGRVPDDEDLIPMTWLLNAAVFGAATGYLESAGHYRGLSRQVSGPLVGLAEDFIHDPVGKAWYYGARTPMVDIRPLIGFWVQSDTPHDIERSVAAGGFRPSTGTSLSGVRAP